MLEGTIDGSDEGLWECKKEGLADLFDGRLTGGIDEGSIDGVTDGAAK